MVDSGQKLATVTDTRLVAVNIAREGLESVTTLRDTFSLESFSSGTCTIGSETVEAFFTTNGSQILTDNCPIVATTTSSPSASAPYYILADSRAELIKKADADG